jgi:hypothetical protein
MTCWSASRSSSTKSLNGFSFSKLVGWQLALRRRLAGERGCGLDRHPGDLVVAWRAPQSGHSLAAIDVAAVQRRSVERGDRAVVGLAVDGERCSVLAVMREGEAGRVARRGRRVVGRAPRPARAADQRHSTAASSTGSANPFNVSERGSESRNRFAPSRLAVLTRISPPPASAPMRAAMWTPWPV